MDNTPKEKKVTDKTTKKANSLPKYINEQSAAIGKLVWELADKIVCGAQSVGHKIKSGYGKMIGAIKTGVLNMHSFMKNKVYAPCAKDMGVLSARTKEIFAACKTGKGAGKAALKQALADSKPYAKRWVNVLLPIASVAACALVISAGLKLNFVLKVTYEGEFVGYVATENTFDSAKKEVNSRVAQLADDEFIKMPTYTIAIAPEQETLDTEDLADNLIKVSSETITKATGLYIGGEFKGAVEEASEIKSYMEQKLAVYREQYPEATITFSNDTRLTDGLYPNESLVSSQDMVALLQSEVQTQKTYVVQKGETLMAIANANGMTTSDLQALNPQISAKSMYTGTELILQASQPMLQVQVVYQATYAEPIAYTTNRTPSSKYNTGYTQTVTKGQNGSREVTAQITLIDGAEVSRDILAATVTAEPVVEEVVYGTKVVSSGGSYNGPTSVVGSGQLKWPVGGNGGYVSCYLYGYYGHTGIDIATSYGTPVYAADSGTVIKAVKQSYGYGWHIFIDHGNGMVTYYAHNSQLYVTAGQTVSKGQHIADVGRTGNATGNHLHFEVRQYGQVKNPLSFL